MTVWFVWEGKTCNFMLPLVWWKSLCLLIFPFFLSNFLIWFILLFTDIMAASWIRSVLEPKGGRNKNFTFYRHMSPIRGGGWVDPRPLSLKKSTFSRQKIFLIKKHFFCIVTPSPITGSNEIFIKKRRTKSTFSFFVP